MMPFEVCAVYIQGIKNRIPDILSCLLGFKPYIQKIFFQHVRNQSIHENKVDDSLFELSHDGTLVILRICENCIGVISLAFMTYTTA